MTFGAPPTTAAGMCNSLRGMLSPSLVDELTILDADYTPGDTTVRLRGTSRRIAAGSLLCWQDNTFYVTGVSATSNQADVVAGYDGSQGSPIPAGTPLRVNPRFTDHLLFMSLRSAVIAVGSPITGLHGVQSMLVTSYDDDDAVPYPPDPNITAVLAVYGRYDTSDWFALSAYRDFPAMRSLRVHMPEVDEFTVVFRTAITAPAAFATDVVADCGLPATAVDVPVLGAAATLMQGQEARRVQQRAQGDPRRAEDVPITGASSSARELYRMYRDRLDEEYARLVAVTPNSWSGA